MQWPRTTVKYLAKQAVLHILFMEFREIKMKFKNQKNDGVLVLTIVYTILGICLGWKGL